jgi:hypothetical protein
MGQQLGRAWGKVTNLLVYQSNPAGVGLKGERSGRAEGRHRSTRHGAAHGMIGTHEDVNNNEQR